GLLPGILAGGLGGAWLARHISSPGLGLFFGLFEILVALQLLLGARPPPQRRLPGAALQGMAGLVIGTVSALLGIGGGTLTVPWLLWHRVDIRMAVGTAATIGLPIALAGALGFALGGVPPGEAPDYSTGFIYWPAAAGIILGSVPLAPAGAWLAHYLPRPLLQRGFALALALIGLKMIHAAGMAG
ncbi:MAG TPA: sulfite exporter TauE/SafE family protein, partial [Gammaproteobacteria bacterium]|nr:sulfite exporter TauE/SafE family protein [Gammaproteobacteria bacterium]